MRDPAARHGSGGAEGPLERWERGKWVDDELRAALQGEGGYQPADLATDEKLVEAALRYLARHHPRSVINDACEKFLNFKLLYKKIRGKNITEIPRRALRYLAWLALNSTPRQRRETYYAQKIKRQIQLRRTLYHRIQEEDPPPYALGLHRRRQLQLRQTLHGKAKREKPADPELSEALADSIKQGGPTPDPELSQALADSITRLESLLPRVAPVLNLGTPVGVRIVLGKNTDLGEVTLAWAAHVFKRETGSYHLADLAAVFRRYGVDRTRLKEIRDRYTPESLDEVFNPGLRDSLKAWAKIREKRLKEIRNPKIREKRLKEIRDYLKSLDIFDPGIDTTKLRRKKT